MDEKLPPSFTELSEDQIKADSVRLLGTHRVGAFSAFSGESYLQRKADDLRYNVENFILSKSLIGGGDELIRAQYSQISTQLESEDHPDVAVTTSSLIWFFRLGFGLVERTAVLDAVQGRKFDENTDGPIYARWRDLSIENRQSELTAYLEGQNAALLAKNLLEPDTPGTLLWHSVKCGVLTHRVTGGEPLHMSALDNLDARNNVIEGSLSALYLLREHHIGQIAEPLEKPHDIPIIPPMIDDPRID
jgi:hypothetical protein